MSNKQSFNFFTVKKYPIQTVDGIMIEDMFATVREDIKKPLGVVGRTYEIVQLSEAVEMMKEALPEAKLRYQLEVRNGQRVYLGYDTDDYFPVGVNDDQVRVRLYLQTSFDGSLKLLIRPLFFRVACSNGLVVPLKTKIKEVELYTKHTKNVAVRLEVFRQDLQMMITNLKLIRDAFNQFAETCVSPEQADWYVRAVVVGNKSDVKTRTQNVIENVLWYINHGAGQSMTPENSLWRLYNGVTGYFQHEHFRNYKSMQNEADVYDSLLNGTLRFYTERAFELAQQLLVT